MALKLDSQQKQHEDTSLKHKLGIRVQGDLGDLKIMESEASDGESGDDEKSVEKLHTSGPLQTLPDMVPNSLIKTGQSPVLSNVAVNNSENVQFGNNTYFHGPVVIKQIINKRGIENSSYTATDNENGNISAHPSPVKTKIGGTSIQKFYVPPWIKVVISVASLVIIGLLCALGLYIQSLRQDDSASKYDPDTSLNDTNYTKVVGMSYDNLHLILYIIFVVPIITILIMFYPLLTIKHFDDIKKTRSIDVTEQPIAIYPDADFNASIEPTVQKADPLLVAANHLRIVSRTDWLAQPVEKELDKIRQPIPWVIITHTATEGCSYQSQCVLRVRLIQMFHIESKHWDDIGYNFLVAGDGSAYYGRGWDNIGAHTLGYNKYSIGIAFVGTFNSETPPQKQFDACQKLIKLGVQLGKISKDYKLFAHRQLTSTLSPGDKIYEVIKDWPHFVKEGTPIEELIPKDY